MLMHEVVEAVEAGDFNIWAVSSIEDGIEILTGVPAGERDEDGEFPEGTILRIVDEQLADYLAALKGTDGEDWKPIKGLDREEGTPRTPPDPGDPPRLPPHAPDGSEG